MPTTTNYGWTTPADTDLLKDGASAIRTLGTAIDTTVFNNAGAAIAKTIVDAKGDIIAATAADTVARLAVGANNTVLTADSSTATGLKWATASSGSMTLLTSGTLSGTRTSLTSINQTYKDLRLLVMNPTMTGDGGIMFETNGETSGYSSTNVGMSNGGSAQYSTASTIFFDTKVLVKSTGNKFVCDFRLLNYAQSTSRIIATWVAMAVQDGSVDGRTTMGTGYQHTAALAAVTQIDIFNGGGITFNGGTYELYGVK